MERPTRFLSLHAAALSLAGVAVALAVAAPSVQAADHTVARLSDSQTASPDLVAGLGWATWAAASKPGSCGSINVLTPAGKVRRVTLHPAGRPKACAKRGLLIGSGRFEREPATGKVALLAGRCAGVGRCDVVAVDPTTGTVTAPPWAQALSDANDGLDPTRTLLDGRALGFATAVDGGTPCVAGFVGDPSPSGPVPSVPDCVHVDTVTVTGSILIAYATDPSLRDSGSKTIVHALDRASATPAWATLGSVTVDRGGSDGLQSAVAVGSAVYGLTGGKTLGTDGRLQRRLPASLVRWESDGAASFGTGEVVAPDARAKRYSLIASTGRSLLAVKTSRSGESIVRVDVS